MRKSFEFSFEWDIAKANTNYKKHGVSFEIATTVFYDPKALTVFDEEHSEGEDRWITLGLDSRMSFIVVHHTYREETSDVAYIRIISVRKAVKKEIKLYQEIE